MVRLSDQSISGKSTDCMLAFLCLDFPARFVSDKGRYPSRKRVSKAAVELQMDAPGDAGPEATVLEQPSVEGRQAEGQLPLRAPWP